jgi:8-oxo-dGTP pyrophosphatase MutT (NUDIX family)
MQPLGSRNEASDALTRYLLTFPDEQVAMAALATQLTTDPHDVLDRKNMRGHITTSAFVIDVTAGKMLLIHHRLYNRWLQPGGHFDGGELLWQSALREVAEETGAQQAQLHAWSGSTACPFDIDTHDIAPQPTKDEGAHYHHDFVYLVQADSSLPLIPQTSEVFDAKWEPLALLDELPWPRFARIAAKLRTQHILKAPSSRPSFV